MVARQAPLSVGFSREEHWSESSFLSPGALPDPGIEPASPDGWQILYQLSHQGSCIMKEEAATEPTPKKTNRKKANWFIWEGFTNSWEKKRSKRQGRKRKICSTEWTVPEKSKERKEGLLKGTSKMIPDGTKNSMKDGYMEKYIRCFNIILKISD